MEDSALPAKSAQVIERRSVRALLLNEHAEILLIRIRSPEGVVFWVTPGGGVEAGENAVMALQRELHEELALQDAAIGPVIWRRHHTYDWGSVRISKREEYRIVTTRRFLPSMQDADEARWVEDMRWWTLGDLLASREQFTPLTLAVILQDGQETVRPIRSPTRKCWSTDPPEPRMVPAALSVLRLRRTGWR
jgi:8-oxo-dGTP pyrophosphatase MutT (NUDIX family)